MSQSVTAYPSDPITLAIIGCGQRGKVRRVTVSLL